MKYVLIALLAALGFIGAIMLGRQAGRREGRFEAQWECKCAH